MEDLYAVFADPFFSHSQIPPFIPFQPVPWQGLYLLNPFKPTANCAKLELLEI
ncbi:MAG: hypothetical protein QXF69_06435 [Thermofilaceae archaeon]